MKNLNNHLTNRLANHQGQGLIEYLIIVAIMAVSTIGIVSVMGQTVKGKFATITNSLQGRTQKVGPTSVDPNLYQKSDLNNFFENSGNTNQ